jgi:threonine/homoserine/homoserine lactone efflux protein
MPALFPEPPLLALFLAAGLTLNITPGPDMLYVVARSLGGRRAEGLVSALGISTGRLIHTLAATLGLSALVAASKVAMTGLQIAGALFLIFLGVRQILAGRTPLLPATMAGEPAPLPLGRVYLQGVATNTLNPKVGLFFLAFLPQFVDAGDPARGPVALQFFALGCLFNLTGTTLHLLLAWMGSAVGRWLSAHEGFLRWQPRISGSLLIALGVALCKIPPRSPL